MLEITPIFNGVARTFSTQKYGCRKRGRNLKISPKGFEWWKTNFTTFGLPRKTSTNAPPPGKIPSDAYAHKHVKLHSFCEKLCCITPPGNTVQQHQCGKQSIVGRQTMYGVFCQTIIKSCQIHCQIAKYIINNIDKVLPKFCNIFFIKRFTLTLNPILIVSGVRRKFSWGGWFSCIWWSFVIIVCCLWRHNLMSYVCFQTNVLVKFFWHNVHTLLHASPYSMCHCTEYKLSALQVTISEEYKFNATTQQFITAKIENSRLRIKTRE